MDLSSLNREELTLLGAGGCTMLALHFSSQLASQHLYYWKTPKEQRAILMIILMAPMYAVYSFVGVLDLQDSKLYLLLLGLVKECYEALVIAKFIDLIYGYLNMDTTVPDEFKGREIRHTFPVTLLQPRTAYLNDRTLKLLKNWTWQFVVTRLACSFLMICLQLLGMYPDWASWTFTVILSISSFVAFYSLLVLFRVFAKELAPHQPLAKFSCIIGIIFFCFWQGVIIRILVKCGVIKSHHFWLDVEHVDEAIKSVVICIEMVGFSVSNNTPFTINRIVEMYRLCWKRGIKAKAKGKAIDASSHVSFSYFWCCRVCELGIVFCSFHL